MPGLKLEAEFQCQFDSARTAAAKEGIADAYVTGSGDTVTAVTHLTEVVADCRGLESAATVAKIRRRVRNEIRQDRVGEIRVIEDVEELRAELRLHSFVDGRVFVECEVPLLVSRSGQRVAPEIAVVAGARYAVGGKAAGRRVCGGSDQAGHGERRQVDVIGGRALVIADRSNDVGTIKTFGAAAVVVLAVVVKFEGLTALQCHCAFEPPTIFQTLHASALLRKLISKHP